MNTRCKRGTAKGARWGALGGAMSLLCSNFATASSEGLWVGQVTLSAVNEVVSAVDENNVRVGPSVEEVTATSDKAFLRLILHVDAGGQVRLLKSVAIADKDADPIQVDEALITDSTFYPDFPNVIRRIASVAFEFGDVRASAAVEAVATAAASAAAAGIGTSRQQAYDDALTASQASIDAAIDAAPDGSPFEAFLEADAFSGSATTAADAAADAAAEGSAEGLSGQELTNSIRSGVLIALRTVSSLADGVTSNELELTGSLTGGGEVSGTLFLGGFHPVNPFRHRRHPRLTSGFDITRSISLTVSEPDEGGDFEPTPRGVDRLSGLYAEEIFGLHKPLGPRQDVGLRTKGVFVIHRISSVAVLNQ